MKWQSTLVLLAATIGLGAYVSLYELRQPDPEHRALLAKQILDIPRETVAEVTVAMPQAQVTLRKQEAGWRLMPQDVRADGAVVDQIVSAATNVTAVRTLNAKTSAPLELAAYGLDPAVGRLEVLTPQGPRTIWLGSKTPTGNHRYARVDGRPDVLVVAGWIYDVADKPAEAFRDPFLLPLDPWRVEAVRLTSLGASWALERVDETWRMTEPVADTAGAAEVTALLRAVQALPISRVVQEVPDAAQRAAAGLETPEILLVVTPQAASAIELRIGTTLPDDAAVRHAMRSDEPALYAVPAAEVAALLREPNALRDTACFTFFTAQVAKVALSTPERAWTLERTDDRWTESGTARALDAPALEAFLNRLADLRSTAFVEDAPQELGRYGLDAPAGTFSVWIEGADTPQRLLVGAVVPESEERYGRLEGRPAVVRLPATVSDLLATTADAFTPAPLEPLTASAAGSPAR